MAKKQNSDGGSVVIVVKNLSPGPRDYPLTDGSSIYLSPRGKGIAWPEISPEQVSDALRLAEKKGSIQLIEKNSPATPKEVNE
ncbi:MAG: hypothetical protein LBQ42_04280 [Synergistaceae bacterium]|jgi:hypothetical protein|nr:hypothetical protein [Synergistaceae bacterium]